MNYRSRENKAFIEKELDRKMLLWNSLSIEKKLQIGPKSILKDRETFSSTLGNTGVEMLMLYIFRETIAKKYVIAKNVVDDSKIRYNFPYVRLNSILNPQFISDMVEIGILQKRNQETKDIFVKLTEKAIAYFAPDNI